MPTSYTPLLGLALPVTGELAGTWGDTVSDYITKYLDAAVAGAQTISGSQTAVTLTTTNGSTLTQAGSGATGSAQYQIINCTGNPASLLTITVPAASKAYMVINSTSTSQSVKVVGAGPTTGVTMVSGEKALIAWDGSDFVKIATSTADGVTTLSFGTTGLTPNSATAGAITVAGTLVAANGGTGQSSYTTGDLLYSTGTTTLSKLGIGTNGQILTSTGTAPQWSTLSGVAVTTFSAGTTGFTPSTATSGAVTLAGTLATTNGGTGLTSFTANRVFYSSSTSAIGSSANLTFDGTTLTANALTTTSTVTLNGGTANGVAYLNGSKVLTTGSALTFDGTALTNTASSSSVLQVTGKSVVFYNTSISDALLRAADDSSTVTAIGFNKTDVKFYSSGSEQMRLTSTGLGIGTSSPAFKLDVNGVINTTAANSGLRITAVAGYESSINFYRAGYNNWFLGSSSNSGDFAIGETIASPTLYFKAGGNLGIGTSSPGAKLDVTTSGLVSSFGSTSTAETYIQVKNGTSTLYLGGKSDQNYVYGTAAIPLVFYTNSTAKATLDSSGNLGLGVTPSAWSSFKAIDVNTISSFASATNRLQVAYNSYWNGTNYIYKTTDAALRYDMVGGQHQWNTAPSGTAGNAISFTQAMTLAANAELNIDSGTGGGRLTFVPGATQNQILSTTTGFGSYNILRHQATQYQWLLSGGTQAMTLTSGGDLLVGTTSNPQTARLYIQGNGYNATAIRVAANGNVATSYLNGSGSEVGYVQVNASTTSYSTSSDYRLKNITGPITNSGAYIDSLRPVEGTWKADGSTFVGLIAHEVQEASRTQIATGTKDGEQMQAMDYSASEIIANLIAEVKSLRARLAAAGI